MKAVALFTDSHMLPGLHATLATLVQSLTGDQAVDVTTHVYLDNVSDGEKEKIVETHERHTNGSLLEVHDFTPTAPTGGNALHGNNVTYGRLALHYLLPDYDQCIYLDSDLLVHRSVMDLFHQFDDEHVVLADGNHDRSKSLDRALYAKAGIEPTGTCFNAGVLGINLKLWRERDIPAVCEETAQKYPGMFRTADQSLLNAVLHDSFKPIGEQWNTPLYPTTAYVEQIEPRIYHFVGAPKPWDFLGSRLSRNYSRWKEIFDQTAIANSNYLRYSSLRRTARISRSMYKAWRDRNKK